MFSYNKNCCKEVFFSITLTRQMVLLNLKAIAFERILLIYNNIKQNIEINGSYVKVDLLALELLMANNGQISPIQIPIFFLSQTHTHTCIQSIRT